MSKIRHTLQLLHSGNFSQRQIGTAIGISKSNVSENASFACADALDWEHSQPPMTTQSSPLMATQTAPPWLLKLTICMLIYLYFGACCVTTATPAAQTFERPGMGIGWVGYEINFNRFFYKYVPPRKLADIDADRKHVEAEIAALLGEVTE